MLLISCLLDRHDHVPLVRCGAIHTSKRSTKRCSPFSISFPSSDIERPALFVPNRATSTSRRSTNGWTASSPGAPSVPPRCRRYDALPGCPRLHLRPYCCNSLQLSIVMKRAEDWSQSPKAGGALPVGLHDRPSRCSVWLHVKPRRRSMCPGARPHFLQLHTALWPYAGGTDLPSCAIGVRLYFLSGFSTEREMTHSLQVARKASVLTAFIPSMNTKSEAEVHLCCSHTPLRCC